MNIKKIMGRILNIFETEYLCSIKFRYVGLQFPAFATNILMRSLWNQTLFSFHVIYNAHMNNDQARTYGQTIAVNQFFPPKLS